MKNLGSAILDAWLPSKWPRLVAGATASLITGIAFLPKLAPEIGLSLTESQISTIRIVGIPWLLVIALVLIHHLVVREKISLIGLHPWKFHGKVTLSIGAYHDVFTKKGEKYFRITLKDISQKKMPPPYESTDRVPDEIKTDVATIGFDPGFFVRHGSRIKKIEAASFTTNEDCFIMSRNEHEEEPYSIYFFRTEDVSGGEQFFRCFVDHINPAKKEVELNIYFLWLNNSNEAGPEGRSGTRP